MVFLVIGVRGVVRGYHVDCSLEEPASQGGDIIGLTQRGHHLEFRIHLLYGGMVEVQMVGRHLRGYRQAFGLGGGHKLDSLRRNGPAHHRYLDRHRAREVLHVVADSGETYQTEVAPDHYLFRLTRHPRHTQP